MRKLVLSLVGAAAFAAVFAGADAAAPKLSFDLRYVAVHGRRLDSVSYDFNGDGRPDLLNTSIDFDVDPPARWFALHLQDAAGSFGEKPDQFWSVDPRACALVFGNLLPDPAVEIGFVASDGVYVYPQEKGRIAEDPVKLLHTRTYFSTPSARSLPVWQWAADLNGDGLSDLIVPLPEGYKVYFQTAPGLFGRISTLEADLGKSAYRAVSARRSAEVNDMLSSLFVYSAALPKVTTADIDGDGLHDLVSITGNVLTIFFQRKPMEYASVPGWRLMFKVTTLEEEVKKDVVHLSNVGFADINGDRNADLVVTQVYGEVGLWDSIKTTIYLHYGNGKGYFTAAQQIKIDGVSMDPEFVDMNGDRRLDCMTSRLRTDLLGQAAKGVILGDVSVTYEVFQFDAKSGGFMKEPVYGYDVRIPFRDLEGKDKDKRSAATRPMMFVRGDFSGDGRPDQVRMNPKTEELEFHQGRDSARGHIDFVPTAWESYKPEAYPKMVLLHDVNGDGRTDVMLLHAGQLGLLLSRKK